MHYRAYPGKLIVRGFKFLEATGMYFLEVPERVEAKTAAERVKLRLAMDWEEEEEEEEEKLLTAVEGTVEGEGKGGEGGSCCWIDGWGFKKGRTSAVLV